MTIQQFVILTLLSVLIITPLVSYGTATFIEKYPPKGKWPTLPSPLFIEYFAVTILLIAVLPRLVLAGLSYQTTAFTELVQGENPLTLFRIEAAQASYSVLVWGIIAATTIILAAGFMHIDTDNNSKLKRALVAPFYAILWSVLFGFFCAISLNKHVPPVGYGSVLNYSNLYNLPITPDIELMERLEGYCGDTSVVVISKRSVQCRDRFAWRVSDIDRHDTELSLFPDDQSLIWLKDEDGRYQALLAINKTSDLPVEGVEKYAKSINERANGVLTHALRVKDSDLHARTGEHLKDWSKALLNSQE